MLFNKYKWSNRMRIEDSNKDNYQQTQSNFITNVLTSYTNVLTNVQQLSAICVQLASLEQENPQVHVSGACLVLLL